MTYKEIASREEHYRRKKLEYGVSEGFGGMGMAIYNQWIGE